MFDFLKRKKSTTIHKETIKNEKIETKDNNTAKNCFCPKIDPFSHCIINPYFKINHDFSKVFSDFETRLGSLQRYFEMNTINIKYYIDTSKTMIKEEKLKNTHVEDDLKKFDRCHFADVDHFYEMHYLSILLILFTTFESLLSNLVNDLSYENKLTFNINSQKELPYINKYIYFLKNECHMNLQISKKEWFTISTIRKVRNNYLHSLDTDIHDDLQKDLLKIITPKKNNKVTVNEEFIHLCFTLFGNLSSKLEDAYWKNKKNTFKIK